MISKSEPEGVESYTQQAKPASSQTHVQLQRQFVPMFNRYPFGRALRYSLNNKNPHQTPKPIVLMTRRCIGQQQQEIRRKIRFHSKLRHPCLIRLLRAYESLGDSCFDISFQYAAISFKNSAGFLSIKALEQNRIRLYNLCSYLINLNIYPEIAQELLGFDDAGVIKLYLDIDFRVLPPGANRIELYRAKQKEIDAILRQVISQDKSVAIPYSCSWNTANYTIISAHENKSLLNNSRSTGSLYPIVVTRFRQEPNPETRTGHRKRSFCSTTKSEISRGFLSPPSQSLNNSIKKLNQFRSTHLEVPVAAGKTAVQLSVICEKSVCKSELVLSSKEASEKEELAKRYQTQQLKNSGTHEQKIQIQRQYLLNQQQIKIVEQESFEEGLEYSNQDVSEVIIDSRNTHDESAKPDKKQVQRYPNKTQQAPRFQRQQSKILEEQFNILFENEPESPSRSNNTITDEDNPSYFLVEVGRSSSLIDCQHQTLQLQLPSFDKVGYQGRSSTIEKPRDSSSTNDPQSTQKCNWGSGQHRSWEPIEERVKTALKKSMAALKHFDKSRGSYQANRR